MADPKGTGRFVWFDLMTTDPAKAIPFYSNVIGWGSSKWEGAGSDQDYTMWMNGQAMIGGVGQLPPDAARAGAPPHWIAYVGTPDVDATVKKAQQLGASVAVPPTDIPTVGRFAMLADPQGAMFAVFTALGDAPGHEGPPNKGEFSWHELMTSDYQAAWDFYSKLFGWKVTSTMDMGPAGMYQMYGRDDGIPMGGMFNKPAEVQGPPAAWLYYAKVDDVNATVETVKKNGGQVLNGPMEVPGGDLIAQCMDPQGAMFAVHSSKA